MTFQAEAAELESDVEDLKDGLNEIVRLLEALINHLPDSALIDQEVRDTLLDRLARIQH